MCGILFTNDESISLSQFRKAFNLMKHRGPDFSRIIQKKNFLIGHHRLSIIDLNKRSNQPFQLNNHILIFNGEIYNYKNLIAEHKLNVKTKSDTEVILLMYLKYGSKCLKYMNGMFSFVIINLLNHEVFAARDRLGIKPLYWWKQNNKIIFSSEISSIVKLKNCDLDDFAIRQYRKLRMTLKDHTFYSQIKSFPPGSYFKNNKIYKYWKLEIEDKKPPKYDELRNLIEDSIKIRKISDVPFGTFLSGGLDSSIISAVAEPNHTWTVGFHNNNEFKWSDLANKKIKSKVHKLTLNKNNFKNILNNMIKKRFEPLNVPNEVLLYALSIKMKNYNTVVLSGEGADELFWGYDRIFKWAVKKKKINYQEFDNIYCYGSNKDDEVIDFALNGLPGKRVQDKISYFMQIYHLHGLLRRLDFSSMLASVEARVPFVDHRLVELVSGTPFAWKFKNGVKSPLKTIFKDLLPDKIISRKKVGFPVNLNYIFNLNENINGYDHWFNYNISKLSEIKT